MRPLPAPEPVGRQLGDAAAVGLAGAAAVGAWWHPAVPLAFGALVPVVALVVRRPWLLVIGVGLLASALAGRAFAGLEVHTGDRVDGVATLVADPTSSPYGVSAEATFAGRRWLVEASVSGAGALGRSLAGERLAIEGRTRPPPPGAGWMVPRHLVGVIAADRVERIDGGRALARAANRLRRTIGASLEGWTPRDRALVLGFVLGDDRQQRPELVADFRGSGLSHLLVVSGQNVVFVLTLCRPLLARLGLASRWIAALAVLGGFGLVTRFEPSVLRASAMAAISITGRTWGRPSPSWRVLALAVAGLVLVDPLLVRSVGFCLSVAATAGVAVLGPRVGALVPGPRPLAEALGTSIAAQLGVAPMLVPVAGGLPVVALPANVVAGWAAGLVTTWGLPTGLVAGWVGPRLGVRAGLVRWLQLPAIACARWVAGVARFGAALPLGDLGGAHLAVLALVVAALLAGAHAGREAIRPIGVGVAVAVLLLPGLRLRVAPPVVLGRSGARVVRSGGATVVDAFDARASADLLEDLRRAGVRRVDVLVVASSGASAISTLVAHRWKVTSVVDERSPPRRRRIGGVEVDASGAGRPVVAVVGAGR